MDKKCNIERIFSITHLKSFKQSTQHKLTAKYLRLHSYCMCFSTLGLFTESPQLLHVNTTILPGKSIMGYIYRHKNNLYNESYVHLQDVQNVNELERNLQM